MWNGNRVLLAYFVMLALPLHAQPTTPEAIAREVIAPLVDQAKVATLKGPRPIQGRTYRVLFWLEMAHRAGGNPAEVIKAAQAATGPADTPERKADRLAIVSNLAKLEALGCDTPEGMAELRKGNAPTITKGPHAGDSSSLDHRIPVAVSPELAAKFF